jgi:hypothetical protein
MSRNDHLVSFVSPALRQSGSRARLSQSAIDAARREKTGG